MQQSVPLLDAATLTVGLSLLDQQRSYVGWHPVYGNDLQRRLFAWYEQNKYGAEELKNLKFRVASSAELLNQFLVENDYTPMFHPFSPGGMGVAAILDMVMEWNVAGTPTMLAASEAPNGPFYTAFMLSSESIEVFDVPGLHYPLVKLKARDGAAAWLLTPSAAPQDGIELVEMATTAMAYRKPTEAGWIESVVIPKVSIEEDVSLDWLIDASLGGFSVSQAFQKVKITLDETGGSAKSMTGIAVRESMVAPLILDQPFIGWFTQAESEFPIACFYSTPDQWIPA